MSRNNVVACVGCKEPVRVTAFNAIRCERCTASRHEDAVAHASYFARKAARQAGISIADSTVLLLVRAALRGPPLEAPPNDTARWLQGLREPLEAPGEPPSAERAKAFEEAAHIVDEFAEDEPTCCKTTQLQIAALLRVRASALPLVHREGPSEGAILAAEQAYHDSPDDEAQFDAIAAALRAAYSVDFGVHPEEKK